MRRLRLDLPFHPRWPYAIAVEVFAGEALVWDGWTSIETLEPLDFSVSAPPGLYFLRVRGRYGKKPVLYEGKFEITGFEGADPMERVTLSPPR